MMDEEKPITMPTDIRSIATLVAVVAAGAVAFSSLKSQSDAATAANATQDVAIARLATRMDSIPEQLFMLKTQNQRMLDLICEGDGAKNRRGCRQ